MDLDELRKSPHLSASQINEYLDCSMLYRFAKIDKFWPEFRSDSMELGSAIHKALEAYYRQKLEGNMLSSKELHEIFEKHWRKTAEGKEDIKYSREKDFETLLLEGKELLTVYHNKMQNDDRLNVIGIEEAFSINVPGIPFPIIGAIDLIEEDSGNIIIVTDFKTSGRAYSNDEIDKNFQLTLYQIAAKEHYPDREILLRFDLLIKNKSPKVETCYTTRSEIDERRAIRKIIQVYDGIKKGVFIPNDGGWRCKGCAYKKACDDWFMEESK